MAFLVIIFICYIIVAIIRKTKIPNEWLPLISSVLGTALSIAAFYVVPSIVPVATVGVTAVYGFFCGLAATGGNQVFKQVVKYINSRFGVNIHIPTINSNESIEG